MSPGLSTGHFSQQAQQAAPSYQNRDDDPATTSTAQQQLHHPHEALNRRRGEQSDMDEETLEATGLLDSQDDENAVEVVTLDADDEGELLPCR
jgi:hypothetical protein